MNAHTDFDAQAQDIRSQVAGVPVVGTSADLLRRARELAIDEVTRRAERTHFHAVADIDLKSFTIPCMLESGCETGQFQAGFICNLAQIYIPATTRQAIQKVVHFPKISVGLGVDCEQGHAA